MQVDGWEGWIFKCSFQGPRLGDEWPANTPMLTHKRAVLGTPSHWPVINLCFSPSPLSSDWPDFLQLFHITDTILSSQPLLHAPELDCHPEDVGSMVLQIVGTHIFHTAEKPSRRPSNETNYCVASLRFTKSRVKHHQQQYQISIPFKHLFTWATLEILN